MAEEITLPTQAELEKLPSRARVAYAVRCAQRVQGLAHPVASSAVEQTIRTTIDAAYSPPTDHERVILATSSAAVASGSRISSPEYSAAMSASFAAKSATVNMDSSGFAAYNAAIAAEDAVVRHLSDRYHDADKGTRERFVGDAVTKLREACQSDITLLLLAVATGDNWTGDSPIEPDALGRLWPKGEPEGWPAQTEPTRYTLEFSAPPDRSDKEIANTIAHVVGLMDRLHRAKGGTGLRLDDDIEAHDDTVVLTPQPSGGGR